jgi:hypothetical protein
MLTGLPSYLIITFLAALVLTYQLFIRAVKNKLIPGIIILVWLSITGFLAWYGFFADNTGTPPAFTLAAAPAFILIVSLFITKKGKLFLDELDIKKLTLVHIVRIPVELNLYWLAAHKAVPELMTFAGKNFDILAGISAPIMYFLCFDGNRVKSRRLLLAWNFICLGLLLNIVIHAVLSAPFSFQQFAFDQPNIAVLFFPFTWLPSFIVMVVLLSHLATIRQLIQQPK